MDALVKRYRPLCFGKVRGQESTVRFLSQLIIRGQIGRDVLLHGQIGSGKTTLARIYAKALNCLKIDLKNGSPCNDCDHCSDSWQELYFHEISAPEYLKKDRLAETLDVLNHEPPGGTWRIIFIDEAHVLQRSEDIIAKLLKRVEDAPERVIYILATSELDRVPAALKSRFPLLTIRPLARTDATDFLREIISEEQSEGQFIDADDDALNLIAGLGVYQPRNMLQCLDQLLPGRITVDRVRSVFGTADVDLLTSYFDALAQGDAASAIERFLNWPEINSEKIRLIQITLLHIYYCKFNGMNTIVDPLVASIEPSRITSIATEFRRRAQASNRDPHHEWREMVKFWHHVSRERNDEVLLLNLTLFHQTACSMHGSSPPITARARRNDTNIRSISVSQLKGRRFKVKPRPRVEHDPRYLSFDHVRQIINTASKCTQAYGVRFNIMLTLWQGSPEVSGVGDAAERMSEFFRDMGGWLKRRDPHADVFRITLKERDPERGYCSRSIVHIDEKDWSAFSHWCAQWRGRSRYACDDRQAIELILPEKKPRGFQQRDAFHRKAVLWLIAGLNPAEKDWDPRSKPPALTALRDLLGLSGPPRLVNLSTRKQVVFSDPLGPKILDKAAEGGMDFLSAFDDHAWDYIMGHWELDEHEDRKEATLGPRRSLNRTVQTDTRLNGRMPPKEGVATPQSQSVDARDRERSWVGWWVEKEI